MRLAIALMLAASVTGVPASAQNATNTVTNEVAAPGNAQQAVLPVTNEEAAAATPAPKNPPAHRGSFPWGLIGLVGLVGLLGRARS